MSFGSDIWYPNLEKGYLLFTTYWGNGHTRNIKDLHISFERRPSSTGTVPTAALARSDSMKGFLRLFNP